MEKSLANIAQTAYWTMSGKQDTFDRVAKAVEAEVLIESMIRPMDLGAVASDALIDAVESNSIEFNGLKSEFGFDQLTPTCKGLK